MSKIISTREGGDRRVTAETAVYDPAKDAAVLDSQDPYDIISRDRWACAAAAVMARSWAPILLHEVIDRGFDEFKRVYRPTQRLHGFTDDNVKAIWRVLERTAKLNPLNGAPNIEEMPL